MKKLIYTKCPLYLDSPITTESEANARLTASAPELLNACKAALAMFKKQFPLEHGNPELGATWGALESAILKAEGRDA